MSEALCGHVLKWPTGFFGWIDDVSIFQKGCKN